MAASREPDVSAASSIQDRVNLRVYHSAGIHQWYPSDAALDRAETMALLKYQPAFAGRDVLDIGIGTGRTSRYLAPLARRYEGGDYSPQMVEYVLACLPHLSIRLTDMRDLSAFGGGTFDFVFASCNVIDAVSHGDRERTLSEVRRVLRPGGLFAFSSHNRRYFRALLGPPLQISRNPVTLAKNAAAYVRSLVNHARVGRLRRQDAEYALLNDAGHEYACLHYYIDGASQQRQLERLGFRLRDLFDASGRAVSAAGDHSASSSLLYVAERQ